MQWNTKNSLCFSPPLQLAANADGGQLNTFQYTLSAEIGQARNNVRKIRDHVRGIIKIPSYMTSH